jgi:hypothetical protein
MLYEADAAERSVVIAQHLSRDGGVLSALHALPVAVSATDDEPLPVSNYSFSTVHRKLDQWGAMRESSFTAICDDCYG